MLNSEFVNSYRDGHILEGTYHKGMHKIWNGKDVMAELLQKYKPEDSYLPEEKRLALARVLSLVVWGEYAAWQTSNILSFQIEDFGGKMAATSQAHDEARHYFTMCDYLGSVLKISSHDIKISSPTMVGLNMVVDANTLSKRLLGMQLMVEPVAISIFHTLRENKVEPILTDLLELYIRDEARHIALGVRQLPKELSKASWSEIGDMILWQANLLKREIDGLYELRNDLSILGIDFVKLFEQGEQRQIDAAKEMAKHLGWNLPIDKIIKQVTQTYMNAKFKGWL